jgi:aspartate kinase
MHIEIFPEHLVELEQLLNGIAMMKELTKRTQDYLVSFGECMSTRIFAAYLNKLGVKARQVRVLLIAYLNLIHAVTKRLFCFFLLII